MSDKNAPTSPEALIHEVEKGLPELSKKRRFRYLRLSIERLILSYKGYLNPTPKAPKAPAEVATKLTGTKTTRKGKKGVSDGGS